MIRTVLFTALAFTLAAPAMADELRGWTLRGQLAGTYATGDPAVLRGDVDETRSLTVDLAEGFGGGFNVEYRTGHRWGVLVDLLWTGYAMTVDDRTIPERPTTFENRYNIYPLLAGPILHLTPPKARFDLYVGALAGWVNHAPANLSDPRNSRADVTDDFGFSGLVGVDWLQGDEGMWFWTASFRMLSTTTRITITGDDGSVVASDYAVNPMTFTFGAGFRLF